MRTVVRQLMVIVLVGVCSPIVLGAGDERRPSDCEGHCREVAEGVKRLCERRGLSPEECEAAVEAALAACLRVCPRPPVDPPPVDPPEPIPCPEACQMRAERLEESCVAMGKDPAECERLAGAHLEMCLRRCDDGDGDDGDPPPTCPDRCERAVERLVAACKERGLSEEECAARGKELLEHCLRGCERVPPPGCKARCALDARAGLAACLREGGDPRECAAKAVEALRGCVAECDGEQPPAPPTCEERCEKTAGRVLMGCLDEGIDEEECRMRAAQQLESCLERCEDPPEPPSCADRCDAAGETALAKCLEAGGDEERCKVLARRVAAECRRHCGRPDPRPCRSRCEEGAKGLARSCEARGLSEEECAERIEVFLAHCRAGCDRPPPQPPTCEERCERRAAAAEAHCLESGGTEEECAAKKEEMLAACIDRCENPPEPPSCEDRCGAASEKVFAECIEDGGDEADCREKADGFLEVCLMRCSRERPLRCAQRCAQRTREDLARCLESDDASRRECIVRAARQLASCVRANCLPEPRPRPSCEERCAAAVERLAKACAERGGDDARCAELVANLEERCLAHCPPPDGGNGDGGDGGDMAAGGGAAVGLSPAEMLCVERGDALVSDCLASGRTPADCELRRASFEETCFVEIGRVEDWLELVDIAPPRPFVRGDSNNDGRVDMADAINTLSGIFLNSGNAFARECHDRLDANDDGLTDISDAVFTLIWLFRGGVQPPEPGPFDPGHDPTFDDHVCFE